MNDPQSSTAMSVQNLLIKLPGTRLHNDVGLNQLVVSFNAGNGSANLTAELADRLNVFGNSVLRTEKRNGETVMRISLGSRQSGPQEPATLAKRIAAEWRELWIAWHAR